MDGLSRQEKVEQRYHSLVQEERYAEALDLATREAHILPQYSQKTIFSWRMDMACRLGKHRLALGILDEAVGAGCWYAGLREDPDFSPLHGDPEFQRLAAICDERRARAIASAAPVFKLIEPEVTRPPLPLLLALHGASSAIEAEHWAPAAAHGWLVFLPQSSQQYSPGTYTWNDWEWAKMEVAERFNTACAERPVDRGRIVLGGFSQGGGLAAHLALGGLIPARGLVLVSPFLMDVGGLVPLLGRHVPENFCVHLAVCRRDRYCYGIARQLAELLPRYGIECRLVVHSDLEHYFPHDFKDSLPGVLDYIVSG